jgi:hypothetical protein
MKYEIYNGIVKSVFITYETDHLRLVAMLEIDHQKGAQCFVLPPLYTDTFGANPQAGKMFYDLLQLFGVYKWEQIAGKPVRVRIEDGFIRGIGHFVKDNWLIAREYVQDDDSSEK